jgi:hypothetical protein
MTVITNWKFFRIKILIMFTTKTNISVATNDFEKQLDVKNKQNKMN